MSSGVSSSRTRPHKSHDVSNQQRAPPRSPTGADLSHLADKSARLGRRFSGEARRTVVPRPGGDSIGSCAADQKGELGIPEARGRARTTSKAKDAAVVGDLDVPDAAVSRRRSFTVTCSARLVGVAGVGREPPGRTVDASGASSPSTERVSQACVNSPRPLEVAS